MSVIVEYQGGNPDVMSVIVEYQGGNPGSNECDSRISRR